MRNNQVFSVSEISISLLALVLSGIVLFIGLEVEQISLERHQDEQRLMAVNQLSIVRAKLESAITNSIGLLEGVASFANQNPDMTQDDFSSFASSLVDKHHHIRNIGIAPDLVIRFIYPVKGNEKAIGLDYRETPTQWDAVKRAVASRAVSLAGPVNLVQGGSAFIGRLPVFLDKDKDKPWGLVSGVIDIPSVYEMSGILDKEIELDLVIQGKDALGSEGDIFFGELSKLEENPVSLKVLVANGEWILFASPKTGWVKSHVDSQQYFNIALTFVVMILTLAGILIFFLRMNNRNQQVTIESEGRLSAIFNGISDGIVLTDNDRRIVASNRGMEIAFGYTFNDIKGRTTSILYDNEEEHRRQEDIRFNMTTEQKKLPYEVNYRRKDGSVFVGETLGVSVKGPDGEKLGFLGVMRDITNRKKTEEALRKSESRIRTIFDNTNLGITISNSEGDPIMPNNAYCSMIGYEMSEVSNISFADITYPDDLPENIRLFNEMKAGIRTHYEIEKRYIRKDGSIIWVRSNVFRLSDEASEDGYAVTLNEDFTMRKQLEEQLRQSQRMEAVGQLTGGVAHDFNNLLGIMIGNAEVLEKKAGDDGKLQSHIDALKKAISRASSLTSRLLAFSRQQPLIPSVTDISTLVDNLEDMLHRTLGEPFELHIEHNPNLWNAIVDPNQLDNALVNLAINARDAMASGGDLTIRTTNITLDQTYTKMHEGVTEGDYVEIAVSDRGIGMPQTILEKAFEPFFTTKEFGKGSGLGLSMVYGFIIQSEGHIAIYSEENHGTTVKLYLPRSHEHVKSNEKLAEISKLERGSERILVVEDNLEIRNIAITVLGEQGYDIVEAENGEEAVKLLEENKPIDLLFTDIILPGGMNGVEIADIARRLQPGIDVLLTTGYADNVAVPEGQIDHDTDLINKPYNRLALLQMVRGIFDRRDDTAPKMN